MTSSSGGCWAPKYTLLLGLLLASLLHRAASQCGYGYVYVSGGAEA